MHWVNVQFSHKVSLLGSLWCRLTQNSGLFSVHVMDFLKLMYENTSIKFTGPEQTLQLNSKYFYKLWFYFWIWPIRAELSHSWQSAYFSLDWVEMCPEHVRDSNVQHVLVQTEPAADRNIYHSNLNKLSFIFQNSYLTSFHFVVMLILCSINVDLSHLHVIYSCLRY